MPPTGRVVTEELGFVRVNMKDDENVEVYINLLSKFPVFCCVIVSLGNW